MSFAEFCETFRVTPAEREKLVMQLALLRALATLRTLSANPVGEKP